MMMKQTLLAALAVCAVSAAQAQPMEGGWHHGGEGMALLRGLNLTDAQKQQARDIEHAAMAQARPAMEQMHAVHEQLTEAMLASGPVTAAQLAPLVRKEELLRTQMDQSRLATMLQIRALLTPEQIAQAAATHTKLAALHEQEHAIIDASAPAPQ